MIYGTILPNDGGSPITSLHLQMDNGLGGDFSTITGFDQNNMATQATLTNVIKGRTYRFRYQAKNINGWSVWSDIAYIKAAIAPF